jgi:rSAM/selenodomain-associated transferase 1
MQFPDARILILAKLPRPGVVKTRLIPVLGASGAAELALRLLRRTVERASGSRLAPVECWVTPNCGGFDRFPWCRGLMFDCHVQCAGDLGQRMKHAFSQALKQANAAVLIGADCPVLQPRHLDQAIRWLETGSDAVLGPAEDGGYVLLGLRRVDPLLFDGMPWGTGYVLEETRRRLVSLGWDWEELEPLWDVDRPQDLRRLNLSCLKL